MELAEPVLEKPATPAILESSSQPTTGLIAAFPAPAARRGPPLPVLLGTIFVALVVAGGGVYLLTSGFGRGHASAGAATPAPSVVATSAPASVASSALATTPASASAATASAIASSQVPAAPTSAANQVPSTAPQVTEAAAPAVAQQQAAALGIATVLAQAGSTRSRVLAATGGLSSCTLAAASANQTLVQAVADRQAALTGLPKAEFSVLPHGKELALLLHKAWVNSLKADQAFADWARDFEASGACGTKNANFAHGLALSKTASEEKSAFATRWNRYIAGPLHQVAFNESQL